MELPHSPEESFSVAGVTVIERGWLSANNILVQAAPGCPDLGNTTLIDTGYVSHSDQTVELVRATLGAGRSLNRIINTHLHSDHCGGNAALRTAFPNAFIQIPPGQASAVRNWDVDALTYKATGQECARFDYDTVISPGDKVMLGQMSWEAHAAKGHDPHSIILFQPELQILISADALWENGFGVVFPELEGVDAFEDVALTLDLIEALDPKVVIPGHGKWFTDAPAALQIARRRLEHFVLHPDKHRRHAVKVLIKYRVLDWQRIRYQDLIDWTKKTPYLAQFLPQGSDEGQRLWLDVVLEELIRSKAIEVENDWIVNI